MRRAFIVMSLVALSLASPAVAQNSLGFATRTNVDVLDLKRVAALSEAVELLANRLTYQLFSVAPEACVLAQPCAKVASEIVQPLATAARDLALLARSYPQATVSNEFMTVLRTAYLDPMAIKQTQLHQSFTPLSRSGSLTVDLSCKDLLDTYWVLLHLIVAHPRDFGGNEGGHDLD